jgi:hypothetical protein
VTYKTGFEFDDQIYWTFIQFVTTQYIWLDTLDFWPHYSTTAGTRFTHCYITLGWTPWKTRPLPSNGCPLVLRIVVGITLAMGCLSRICLCGNVFIEPLPSNGFVHHNNIKMDLTAIAFEVVDWFYITFLYF